MVDHARYDVAMERVGVVTEHGRGVAALCPVAESDEDRVLLDLVREGRAEWGGGKPEGARRPSQVEGPSVSEAVIEDRQ